MLRQSQHERKLINNSKRPPVAPVKQPARLRQLRLSSRPVLNWEKGVKPFRPSGRSLVQKFKRFMLFDWDGSLSMLGWKLSQRRADLANNAKVEHLLGKHRMCRLDPHRRVRDHLPLNVFVD